MSNNKFEWGFDEDYRKWSSQQVIEWISQVDSSFESKYAKHFLSAGITGAHIPKFDEKFLINELGVMSIDAVSIATRAKFRIEKFESARQKARQPSISPAKNNFAPGSVLSENYDANREDREGPGLNEPEGLPHGYPEEEDDLDEKEVAPSSPRSEQEDADEIAPAAFENINQQPSLPILSISSTLQKTSTSPPKHFSPNIQHLSNFPPSIINNKTFAPTPSGPNTTNTTDNFNNNSTSNGIGSNIVNSISSSTNIINNSGINRTNNSNSLNTGNSNKQDPLPYNEHPPPSMKSMSNRFRATGPNRILYPPKNGPRVYAKKKNILLQCYDPEDDLKREEVEMIESTYANVLDILNKKYGNSYRNLRAINRHKGNMDQIENEYRKFEPVPLYIGARVMRGPDWKWGNQDGEKGLLGTVRGLRQWHPSDDECKVTEAVVLWDIGLYGNYRYGYFGAYDVQIHPKFLKEMKSDENLLIKVGSKVMRKKNWRWGNQDGGEDKIGRVLELYASPAPFDAGVRVAVLWDHEKEKFKTKYRNYQLTKLEEKDDDPEIENGNNNNKKQHQSTNDGSDSERESDWDEPPFEEVLSRPLIKYRWGIENSSYDLSCFHQPPFEEDEYLMVDDRVVPGPHFKELKKSKKKKNDTSYGIVLKIESWDYLNDPIHGDKIYLTWDSKRPFKFNHNGEYEIKYQKRGIIFPYKFSRIRVGDRVERGPFWDEELYGNEDGNYGKGTVVGVQYVLETGGILAKVKWTTTNHINLYSWGFKKIYDLDVITDNGDNSINNIDDEKEPGR